MTVPSDENDDSILPIGTVVWASLETYPAWPARVIDRSEVYTHDSNPNLSSGKCLVMFFNDGNKHSTLDRNKLKIYNPADKVELRNRTRSRRHGSQIKMAAEMAEDFIRDNQPQLNIELQRQYPGKDSSSRKNKAKPMPPKISSLPRSSNHPQSPSVSVESPPPLQNTSTTGAVASKFSSIPTKVPKKRRKPQMRDSRGDLDDNDEMSDEAYAKDVSNSVDKMRGNKRHKANSKRGRSSDSLKASRKATESSATGRRKPNMSAPPSSSHTPLLKKRNTSRASLSSGEYNDERDVGRHKKVRSPSRHENDDNDDDIHADGDHARRSHADLSTIKTDDLVIPRKKPFRSSQSPSRDEDDSKITAAYSKSRKSKPEALSDNESVSEHSRHSSHTHSHKDGDDDHDEHRHNIHDDGRRKRGKKGRRFSHSHSNSRQPYDSKRHDDDESIDHPNGPVVLGVSNAKSPNDSDGEGEARLLKSPRVGASEDGHMNNDDDNDNDGDATFSSSSDGARRRSMKSPREPIGHHHHHHHNRIRDFSDDDERHRRAERLQSDDEGEDTVDDDDEDNVQNNDDHGHAYPMHRDNGRSEQLAVIDGEDGAETEDSAGMDGRKDDGVVDRMDVDQMDKIEADRDDDDTSSKGSGYSKTVGVKWDSGDGQVFYDGLDWIPEAEDMKSSYSKLPKHRLIHLLERRDSELRRAYLLAWRQGAALNSERIVYDVKELRERCQPAFESARNFIMLFEDHCSQCPREKGKDGKERVKRIRKCERCKKTFRQFEDAVCTNVAKMSETYFVKGVDVLSFLKDIEDMRNKMAHISSRTMIAFNNVLLLFNYAAMSYLEGDGNFPNLFLDLRSPSESLGDADSERDEGHNPPPPPRDGHSPEREEGDQSSHRNTPSPRDNESGSDDDEIRPQRVRDHDSERDSGSERDDEHVHQDEERNVDHETHDDDDDDNDNDNDNDNNNNNDNNDNDNDNNNNNDNDNDNGDDDDDDDNDDDDDDDDRYGGRGHTEVKDGSENSIENREDADGNVLKSVVEAEEANERKSDDGALADEERSAGGDISDREDGKSAAVQKRRDKNKLVEKHKKTDEPCVMNSVNERLGRDDERNRETNVRGAGVGGGREGGRNAREGREPPDVGGSGGRDRRRSGDEERGGKSRGNDNVWGDSFNARVRNSSPGAERKTDGGSRNYGNVGHGVHNRTDGQLKPINGSNRDGERDRSYRLKGRSRRNSDGKVDSRHRIGDASGSSIEESADNRDINRIRRTDDKDRRHRSKHQHRSKDRDDDISPDLNRQKKREKDRDKERNKHRDVERERGRDRSRDRGLDRDWNRDRDRVEVEVEVEDRERNRDKSKERDRDRDKDRGRDRDSGGNKLPSERRYGLSALKQVCDLLSTDNKVKRFRKEIASALEEACSNYSSSKAVYERSLLVLQREIQNYARERQNHDESNQQVSNNYIVKTIQLVVHDEKNRRQHATSLVGLCNKSDSNGTS